MFILATCVGASAQKCNLQGVVQYYHNKYVGYKLDVGAEVYLISVKNAKNINIEQWNSYENLAKKYYTYCENKQEGFNEKESRFIANFWDEDENRLKDLDAKCSSQYLSISEDFEFIALVDNSGKYELSVPYGEYYIFVKSKHRDRPLTTESLGRILAKKVKLEKPTKLISFDFDK